MGAWPRIARISVQFFCLFTNLELTLCFSQMPFCNCAQVMEIPLYYITKWQREEIGRLLLQSQPGLRDLQERPDGGAQDQPADQDPRGTLLGEEELQLQRVRTRVGSVPTSILYTLVRSRGRTKGNSNIGKHSQAFATGIAKVHGRNASGNPVG